MKKETFDKIQTITWLILLICIVIYFGCSSIANKPDLNRNYFEIQ